jgi:hypothetical protein
MKKVNVILTLAAVILSGFVFQSCQKEDALRGERKVMAGYVYDDCEEQCIESGSGDYFYKVGSLTGTIGQNSKTIGYKYYNTETHFVVEVSYNRTPASSGASSTIKVTVGSSEISNTIVNGNSATYSFPLASGWAACGLVSFSIAETDGDGTWLSGNGSYNLIGICQDCTESFTYVDNGDGTYIFTYTPEEDLTGAEVVFTFAQGVAVSGLEGWSVNGSTRQKTLDFVACVPVTWTVTLAADCSGKSGASNVWTDFKVNGVSLKADPADKFVQICN